MCSSDLDKPLSIRGQGFQEKEPQKKAMSKSTEKFDLETIRHSAAHLMAQAVKQLYPETKVTIGPVIEDGFYYDFFREQPFVPEDLEKIEARMQAIAKQNLEIVRQEIPRAEALKMFDEMGESFKREIIEGIDSGDAQIGRAHV